MTTLLDEAIARVRELPDAEQDRAADVLLQIVERDPGLRLTSDQVAEVERTIVGLRDGSIHCLTDEQVDAMWQRFRA